MPARYSDAFNIVKEDIGKSVYKKHFKGLTEWWVYRQKESRFVDTRGKTLDEGESYLYCIILCEGDVIRQQNKKYIAIEGVKLTENELDEYLSRNGRA